MRAGVVLFVVLAACTTSQPALDYDAAAGTAPGICPLECADTCTSSSTPATVTCRSCLERAVAKGGPCEAPVVAACQPDPDCMAEQQCVAFCQGNADAGADQVCGGPAGVQACANCCASRHARGYGIFFNALIGCGCGR